MTKCSVVLLTLILASLFSYAAEENLDELFARKARQSSATYNVSLLENRNNNYVWQPETMMYNDVQTGHEVWRMSNTLNLNNYYQMDIGVSPWSADGKRFAFTSWRRYTKAYPGVESWDNGNSYIYMISDTDGKNLRPAIGSPKRIGGGYFHWSPQIPDTFYETGTGNFFPWDQRPNDKTIFNCAVTDTGITSTPLLTYSFSGPDIGKFISPDGRKIIANRWISDSVPLMFYPSTVYPDSQAMIDIPNGYSQDRNFGPYGDTLNPIPRYHDGYYAGDGSWYFGMPSESGGSWWRIKTLGSATDGGGLYTGDIIPPSYQPPYDFGEVWPENHERVTLAGHIISPWVQDTYLLNKSGYWSHFVPDMWGRYALFSSVCDNLPKGYGPGVWDIQKHTYSVASFGGGAQHHDWHGFTDYVVSSFGLYNNGSYLGDRIYAAKYNDENSQSTICYTHTRYNGGTEYNSLTRPGQSPDGTKVAWHSEFLNHGASMTDIFWTVVYYPYPPTNLTASWNGGIRISFLPPKYTERGWPFANSTKNTERNGSWPELDLNGREMGEALYSREIKKFHIWRSSSQNGPWQEIGTVNAIYSHTYHPSEDPRNELMMLHPVDANGRKISESNKIYFTDNPGIGTFYYALTSEEYSSLESDELSEIVQVTVSGTTATSQVVQPKGQKNFWTAKPQSPANLNYTTTRPGDYIMSWSEPADSKIRYYNIYYSTSGDPPADQEHRIASLPVGTSTYLDWLADKNNDGYYGITSVDRYGNEGDVVYLGNASENGTCGDGYCENETCSSCPADCGPCGSACGPADTNLDNIIKISEIMNYAWEWKSGDVVSSDLRNSIDKWKNGCQ